MCVKYNSCGTIYRLFFRLINSYRTMNRGSDIQGKVLHGFTVRRYVGRLYVFVACIALLWPVCVCAQPRKVQNLPYADHKLLHLGFSIGTHVQDMKFVHSGFVTDGGESWYMEYSRFFTRVQCEFDGRPLFVPPFEFEIFAGYIFRE